jgi:hypothetical protein
MTKCFGCNRVLLDLVRTACDFHFADIAKESLKQVRAGESIPLQGLLQGTMLLLSGEGTLQDAHDWVSDARMLSREPPLPVPCERAEIHPRVSQ